ncbi:MAG TPA: hypothetical protein VGK26_12455, partial [Thermoanaerobaculia bacterium]
MPAPRPIASARVLLLGVLAVLASLPGAGRQVRQGVDPDAPVVTLLRERLARLRVESAADASQPKPQAQVAASRALPEIYDEAGDRPLWTPDRLDTLLALVRESAEDGLRPEDYHLEELTRRAASIAPGADPATRAETDLLATDAFFLLV